MTCMKMVSCPMENFMPGMSESMYGGAEMGEEPRLALMDSDVPNAMTKSIITKAAYLRTYSALLLLPFISFMFLISGVFSPLLEHKIRQNRIKRKVRFAFLFRFDYICPCNIFIM